MNIIIEAVDVNKAVEICEKGMNLYTQPCVAFDGSIKAFAVDLIINDVCSIKQDIEYDNVLLTTRLGYHITIHFNDYRCIKIV